MRLAMLLHAGAEASRSFFLVFFGCSKAASKTFRAGGMLEVGMIQDAFILLLKCLEISWVLFHHGMLFFFL